MRPDPVDFAPTTEVLVPSGKKSRARANIEAIRLLNVLDSEDRYPTADEQPVLARWSGWGAVPEVFDPRRDDFADERAQLEELLPSAEWNLARQTILNAHYTDPAVVATTWQLLGRAGFAGGPVLEPGSGSGTFIAHSPADAQMVGVELDTTTARISAALYPSAQVRNESFAATALPDNVFAAAVGNVPFGAFKLWDSEHNRHQHTIHNHFILKSLDLTAPGGYVAVLTSRYTADTEDPKARNDIADRADLVGAVRLPTGAFRRVAGTDVVTDLLVLRVREHDRAPTAETKAFVGTTRVSVPDTDPSADAGDEPMRINRYFAEHPDAVLGELSAGHGLYGRELLVTARDGDLDAQITAQLGPVIDRAVADGYGHTVDPRTLTLDAGLAAERGLVTPTAQWSDVPLHSLRYHETQNIIEVNTKTGWEPSAIPKSRVAETRAILDMRDTVTSLLDAQRDRSPDADKDALRALLNDQYDRYRSKYGYLNRYTLQEPRAVTQSQHDSRLAVALQDWVRDVGKAEGYDTVEDVPEEVLSSLDEQAWQPTSSPTKKQAHLPRQLREDPALQNVLSIEAYNDDRMVGTKTAIMNTDVLDPPRRAETASTIGDAVALCMDERASIDVERIAELLDSTRDEVVDQLAEHRLAFRSTEDPNTWIPAPRYLSGNVRTKLRDVEDLAADDDRYRSNVAALREVIPARIETGIRARLGVTWVTPADYEQFITETFRVAPDSVTVRHEAGRWYVEEPSYYPQFRQDALDYGVVPQNENSRSYNFTGTQREQRLPNQGVSAGRDRSGIHSHWDILDALMNSKPVTVNRSKDYKEADPDGGEVHAAATRAAKQKAEILQSAFTDWALNGDPERRERLITEYNWRFNATVAPSYDGSTRSFPGLGRTFNPYPYQRNAVERIVNEPSVLLNHVVGAGKTGTMLMGAMELKRLGLVRQPWIVVPNHICDQVSGEAAQWYPGANVLSGSGRTTAEDRQRLIAQSVSQDWDVVIVPQSVFTRINTSADTRARFMEDQLDELREAHMSAADNDADAKTLKSIEQAIKSRRYQLEKALDQARKDTGLTFENTRADYLFIDEAHMYKNLSRVSGIQELAHQGSQQAMDLDLKLSYLRERKRQEALDAGLPADAYVERIACFATGTPVANSLAELFVMQHYLRPDLLEHAGVETIDEWGSNFTDTTETVELNASGTKLRSVTRVGRFANVGDLVGMTSMYSDVVTREQVPANLPTKTGGHNTIVDFQPGQETRDFIQDLGYRADTMDSARMDLDNALKIANDGRNVSLDPRTAHLDPPGAGGRAREVAQRILTEWRASRDTTYLDSNGDPASTPGSLQILFCDRSVPTKDGRWTMYAGIKNELIAGGMDANRIAYVHDYPKPEDKARLYAACREGRVNVLMGSTEKMGTGTNVQDRAIALHHVDVPWRPADLEQREGRIIRQGNQNPEVRVYNYVATGTYDTAMWQTLNRKAAFLDQLYSADRSIRSIEDLSTDNLAESTALTKAIATGDDRYMRKVELERDIEGLEAQRETHLAEVRSRREETDNLTRRLPSMQGRADALEAALPELTAWSETENKSYTVGDGRTERTHSVRKEAADHLLETLRESYVHLQGAGPETDHVATIAGHEIHARRMMEADLLHLHVDGLGLAMTVEKEQLWPERATIEDNNRAAVAGGILTRLENTIGRAPRDHHRLTDEVVEATERLEELRATPEQPFPHEAALRERKTELEDLSSALASFENSDEAKQARAAMHARMAARGREPGWSLMLNPTPALVEELDCETADEVRDIMRHREIQASQQIGLALDDDTPDTAPPPPPEEPETGPTAPPTPDNGPDL